MRSELYYIISVVCYLMPKVSIVVAFVMAEKKGREITISTNILVTASTTPIMPSPNYFAHYWVVFTQNFLFSCIPSTVYGFMSKIIARKTISIKWILMTKFTFSMRPLSLRGKGPCRFFLCHP